MADESPSFLESTIDDVHARMKAGVLTCVQFAQGYPDVQVLPPTYTEVASGKWICLSFPTNTVVASQSHCPRGTG